MSDLRLAALLCTRLCHDLIGPVGAINNGLELLEEPGAEPGAGMEREVVDLLRHSAGEAARRLQFFRTAFGLPGGMRGGGSFDGARDLARGLLEAGKVSLDWQDAPAAQVSNQEAVVQLVLNLTLTASEALPRGGAVAVRFENGAGLTVRITASGQGAAFADAVREGLSGAASAEDLTPRTVHSYFTAQLAAAMGARVDLNQLSVDQAEIVTTVT